MDMIQKKKSSGPDTGSGPGPKKITIKLKAFLKKKNDKILKSKESREWEE